MDELLPLGFGYCALVLAVPEESRNPRRATRGQAIATSYPNSAARYFAERA